MTFQNVSNIQDALILLSVQITINLRGQINNIYSSKMCPSA